MMKFLNSEHEQRYNECINRDRTNKQDHERKAMFYILSSDRDIYKRINELYIFSENRKDIKEITNRLSFGGGCVNDVVIHLATSEMGFGGVGESGMGAYHGKTGFEAFSHTKSIVDKKTFMDLPMRYQPYDRKINKKLLKLFLK